MWQKKDNQLYCSFEFKDFSEAFAFMVKVAEISEQMNHHPTWKNQYNKVEIWLSTHDEGGLLTEKDLALAKAIDGLV